MAVWTTATGAAALVARLVAPVAVSGWSAVRHGDLGAMPFDRALVSLASAVLLGCLVWAWVAVTVVVAEAAFAGEAPCVTKRLGPWRVPLAVRRAVLAACGVALVGAVAQPALADTRGHAGGHRHGIAGLPLPDRATAAPEPGRPAHGSPTTVVVSTGDSLWSIAAEHLPSGASVALVTDRWHTLYAANRKVVGPDPDHLEPGQRLRLPHHDEDLP